MGLFKFMEGSYANYSGGGKKYLEILFNKYTLDITYY